MVAKLLLVALALALGTTDGASNKNKRGPNYYGTFVGNFSTFGHDTSGSVYVVNDSTFFIKNFTYDGSAPLAVFWVDFDQERVTPYGTPVPYPETKGSSGNIQPLGRYHQADIILKLPLDIKVKKVRWLAVWCRRFTVNFGEVRIPENIQIPQSRMLPEFSRLAHGLRSDNITILDSKTFYIPNLHYDGAGPDAYFWIGKGSAPHEYGMKVPNEVGSLSPLKGYDGVDIEIVLPDNITVYDIDWLGVWCVAYKHNFGYVLIPDNLDVPPALGQTKIATSSTQAPEMSCIELLEGRVQVQWQTMDQDVQIRVSARIREDQYVAFGLSGLEGKAEMIGADVVVVGYNKRTNQYYAEDYYMSDYAQCDGKRGVCPDHRLGGKNDAVLVSGRRHKGVTSVTYKRPLRTNELEFDKTIVNSPLTIIAAIGQYNHNWEANAHLSSDVTTEDIRINFFNEGVHECVKSLYDLPETPDIEAWPPQKIVNENELQVKIGPTGGNRGYIRITGQPPWGIAFWVNEKLIPEITVERGSNYTFIVETGNDKTNPAKYHPFYITSSPEGGFGQLKPEQRRHETIFAGVDYDESNYPYPTTVGRYCEYVHKTIDQSAKTKTFEEYKNTVRLECQEGEPGKLVWQVEESTPNEVYYQCYTHKNLGWKIKVVDQGQALGSESDAATGHTVPSLLLLLALASITALARQR